MRQIILSLILACTWMSTNLAHAEICKWVDENGITHYETKCPDEGGAEVLKIDTGPGGEAGDEAPQDAEQPEEFPPLERDENSQAEIALAPPQPSVLDNAEVRDRCVAAMTNLVVLQLQASVFYDDQGVLHPGLSDRARTYEGARTYVSDQERDTEILRYRNFLRDNCGRSEAERKGIADLFAAQKLQGIQEEICADKVSLMNRLQVGITGLPTAAAQDLRNYIELNCN